MIIYLPGYGSRSILAPEQDDECVASTIGSKLKQSAVANVSPDCISRKRQNCVRLRTFDN